MHSKLFYTALYLLPAALAQTHSLCNPMKGCFQDNPALGTTYTHDFVSTKAPAPGFDIVSSKSRITYEADGMHMAVQMKGDSPTLQSQFYIFWGRLDVVMKAGPGSGIISSLVFQSDVLDEIDVEFVGSQNDNVQTNIFSKGNQEVYIYGGNHAVNDISGTFHTYSVDWTPTAITWSVNGNVVRVLPRADLGDVYPQTPMQIKLGPWAAGDPSNPPGTIEWAGGEIDYSKAPFDMVVQSFTVTDYSKGAKLYKYKDGSGHSDSIEIVMGGGQVPSATKSTTTAKPTTTTKSTTTSAKPTSTEEEEETTTTKSAKPTKTEDGETSTTRRATSTFSIDDSEETDKPAGGQSTFTTVKSTPTQDDSVPAESSPPADSGASIVRLGWSLAAVAGAFVLLI